MARCDCTVRYATGMSQRCVQEATRPDGKCYLHSKYFAGLCSPVEFDSDVPTAKLDTVAEVSDSRGNRKSY